MSMTEEEVKRMNELESKLDQLIKLAEVKTADTAPATTSAVTAKQDNQEEIPGWFMAYLATQQQANAPAATEEDKKDTKKERKEKATKIMAGVGVGLTALLALGKVYALGQGSGYDARNKELLSLPDSRNKTADAEYNELDLTV